MSKKRKNRIKAIVLVVMVMVCEVCGLFPSSETERVYAATGGQTASNDVLNVILTTDGTTQAVMGNLSESSYAAVNDTPGQQCGIIALDNALAGGYMHVNIGQTIDMYVPASDVDYTDAIGFSGNYTFQAAGGRGGTIVAKDTNVSQDVVRAIGGYGSVITNSLIDYNTGQSITYRLGSNGRNVGTSEATNTVYWDDGWDGRTTTDTLAPLMGNVNAGLFGDAYNYKGYSACAQVGTASYIQISGDRYIVAGGGAPGVVYFECKHGVYGATATNGAHADESDLTKLIPSGFDGFANPGSPSMTKRYRDYEWTSNINAGRIAGTSMKNGVPVSSATYSMVGTWVMYEDVFVGHVCTPADNVLNSQIKLSKVFPGYSGLASRNGSKFSTEGLSDSTYSVSIDSSATQSSPYLKLTCNAKYITIDNPTRAGYTFTGWTCGNGVSVVSNNGSSYRFKITSSGATITANWKAVEYTIAFDTNGGTGALESITAHYDEDVTLPDGSTSFMKYTADGVNVTGDVLAGNLIPAESAGADENEAGETEADENETGENGTGDTAKAYASVFLGWALEDEKDLLEPRWTAGELVRNLTEQYGGVVTLYAVWDDCPWIQATDLYYTLEQAQSGFITEEEILSHMTASDREDGSPILPGTHDNGTSFTIPDYSPTDFTQFDGDGSCTENLTVTDSAGSIYVKQITVYVVDTTPRPVKPEGTTRFINEYYYNQPYEMGGLADDSIWKTNPEYVAEIQTAFDNLRNDTPQEVYYFTHEQILEMKEFVSEHGIGNSKESDALSRFYDEFMAPNRVK